VTTERKQQEKAEDKDENGDDGDKNTDMEDDDITSDPSAFITTTSYTPFLYLSLKLPPTPLFKDSQQQTIIPQIPLYSLLSKFDSHTVEHSLPSPASPHPQRRVYTITRLPRYLIIHYQRFSDNVWYKEKNPTLVTFPLRGLDMTACVGRSEREGDVDGMGVKDLLDVARRRGVDIADVIEVDELRRRVKAAEDNVYDLICNIVHEGEASGGMYRVHVLHRPNNVWYEVEDLRVSTSETMAQMVGLSQAYIQIYERRL